MYKLTLAFPILQKEDTVLQHIYKQLKLHPKAVSFINRLWSCKMYRNVFSTEPPIHVTIGNSQAVLRIWIPFLLIWIRAGKLNPDLDPGRKLNPDAIYYNGKFENRT